MKRKRQATRSFEPPVVIVSNHDEGKSIAEYVGEQEEKLREAFIKGMVNRFLGWKLPEDFRPDGGITYKSLVGHLAPEYQRAHAPTGTNLFDATQAEAMVRYMLNAEHSVGSKQAEGS